MYLERDNNVDLFNVVRKLPNSSEVDDGIVGDR